MDVNELHALFRNGLYEIMSISKLCEWGDKEANCRLFLPPIQRSIVWSNEQVINYWDSLLRGYPPGMMLVHRTSATAMGRDINTGHMEKDIGKQAFQLFDGQQRMTAILLAFGNGQMKNMRRLWIDLGSRPSQSSGLKFQLRMSSLGQPFGYRADTPNQKIELGKRRDKWVEWSKGSKNDIQNPFSAVTGNDLIDARCTVPFEKIYSFWKQNGTLATIEEFSKWSNADKDIVVEFIGALASALMSEIIVHEVAPNIVEDQGEYIRFFGRLGQGGTRLSDDELTYSIIKYCFPEIHDSVQNIMTKHGRLADEIDLVLASLRVAKGVTTWQYKQEWEQIARPTPDFVSQLRDDPVKEPVRSEFLKMIGSQEQPAELEKYLGKLRDVLSFDRQQPESTGLPKMMFAHLPRELIDVLILFAAKKEADSTLIGIGPSLRAFVLYWLLFVTNHDKAAWTVFKHAKTEDRAFTADSFPKLIREFEQSGAAYAMPRANDLDMLFRVLRSQVEQRDMALGLCSWAERFTAADEGDVKPGEALRFLSTNRKRTQLALMWLQRLYISTKFPDYDPTSDRDEDLPIDLDHIIPHEIFGFDWRHRERQLHEEIVSDVSISQNFRDQRGLIGNSIGNFRWLDAPDNRSRQNGPYEPIDSEGKLDLVSKPDQWNRLISREQWGQEDIAIFQRAIDLRTLELYEIILRRGIKQILSE